MSMVRRINIRKGQILGLALIVFMFIRDELNQSITNIQATKQKQEDKNYCLHERGLDGYWLQDWRYANRTNYPIKNLHQRNLNHFGWQHHLDGSIRNVPSTK